jgi:hypothetical protein
MDSEQIGNSRSTMWVLRSGNFGFCLELGCGLLGGVCAWCKARAAIGTFRAFARMLDWYSCCGRLISLDVVKCPDVEPIAGVIVAQVEICDQCRISSGSSSGESMVFLTFLLKRSHAETTRR